MSGFFPVAQILEVYLYKVKLSNMKFGGSDPHFSPQFTYCNYIVKFYTVSAPYNHHPLHAVQMTCCGSHICRLVHAACAVCRSRSGSMPRSCCPSPRLIKRWQMRMRRSMQQTPGKIRPRPLSHHR